MYSYKAFVTNVVDGDTVDVEVDLGFKIKHGMRVRVDGVDTPELRSSNSLERTAAKYATAYVEKLILGQTVYLRTYKPKGDKYGRFLAQIYINEDIHHQAPSLSQVLLTSKTGRLYEGGKRIDWTIEQLEFMIDNLKDNLGIKI